MCVSDKANSYLTKNYDHTVIQIKLKKNIMSLETHPCISLSTQSYPLASIQIIYWEGEKMCSCSCLEKVVLHCAMVPKT